MGSKLKQPTPRERVELPRHISVPILLLMLLALPWFFGGREAFGHLLSAGLSLLLFLSWLLMSRHRALRVDIRPLFVIGPLAVIIGWSALSLIWTVSLFQSSVLLMTMLEAALAFVVARDVLHEDVAPDFFLRLWTIAAFIIWVIGVALFAAGNYDRMTSLFYWANPLATYFLAGILTGLASLRASKGRASMGWLLTTGALVSGLLLTYSRAAWLIAILLMVVLLAISRERRREALRLAQVFLIGCVLAVGIITVRHAFYKQPVVNVQARITESATSTSVKDRFSYWQEASVLFANKPLTGWGVGSYSEVHPGVQLTPTTAGSNPHNSIFQSLVELGLVGGITYLVLIGGWLWQGWQILKVRRSELALTAWLVVSAIVLHSWLDLVTNYPVLIISGALWMALALPAPHIEFRLKRWFTSVPLVLSGLAMLLALAVSWNVYLNSIDTQLVDISTGQDFDTTQARYQTIAQRFMTDPDLLSQAAVGYIDEFDARQNEPAGFLDPARSYAERAAKQEPQDAKHVFALANVLERQGKVTESLANYRQAIVLDPHNNPQYQTAYARLLQREGSVTEAIVVMKTILNEYTPEVIANRSSVSISQRLAVGQAVLADLYVQKADFGRAQDALTEAERLSPSNAFVQQVKATFEAAQK